MSFFSFLAVFALQLLSARVITDPFGLEYVEQDLTISDEKGKAEDTSCAYTTTGGMAAVPLNSCWQFEQTVTSGNAFSYDFTAVPNAYGQGTSIR